MDTGGGGSVGGDLGVGRDFTGRDTDNRAQTTNVNITEQPRTFDEVRRHVQQIGEEVADLKSVVFGNERFGLNGVMRELRAITDALADLTTRVNSIHEDNAKSTAEQQKTRAEIEAIKREVGTLNTKVTHLSEQRGQVTKKQKRTWLDYAVYFGAGLSLLAVAYNALHAVGMW